MFQEDSEFSFSRAQFKAIFKSRKHKFELNVEGANFSIFNRHFLNEMSRFT